MRKFFSELAFDPKTGEISIRPALLALIIYYHLLIDNGIECDFNARELFCQYLKKFGGKPFFFRDLEKFFQYVKNSDGKRVITDLSEMLIQNQSQKTETCDLVSCLFNFILNKLMHFNLSLFVFIF